MNHDSFPESSSALTSNSLAKFIGVFQNYTQIKPKISALLNSKLIKISDCKLKIMKVTDK